MQKNKIAVKTKKQITEEIKALDVEKLVVCFEGENIMIRKSFGYRFYVGSYHVLVLKNVCIIKTWK